MSTASIGKVFRFLPVNQIIVRNRFVMTMLDISRSVVSNKDISVIDIVENGDRCAPIISSGIDGGTSRFSIGIVSICFNRLVCIAWFATAKGIGAKSKSPMESITFPSAKREVIGANLSIHITAALSIRLEEHGIEGVGDAISYEIISSGFCINTGLICCCICL